MFSSSDIISTYTREQAIEDGLLIDVTEAAGEAGFLYPVAITAAAWESCVAWSAETQARKDALQDESGRLWDVVWMASRAACAAKKTAPRDGPVTIFYRLYVVPAAGRGTKARLTTLRLSLDGGDNGRGAFLISLPGEAL